MLACEPSGLALLGISVQGLGKNFPQLGFEITDDIVILSKIQDFCELFIPLPKSQCMKCLSASHDDTR